MSFFASMFLNLRLGLGALVHQPLRSFLTLLGIVIGIVALVVMMSLIEALGTSVSDATRPLGVGTFQVQKEPRFSSRRVGTQEEQRRPFTMDDLRLLRERLELTREVGGEMWAWMTSVRTETRKTEPACGMAGVTPPFMEANGLELEAGRFITEADIALRRSVVVVGSDVVERLFPFGNEEALGSTVRVRGKPFEVVGTFKKRPTLFGAAWRNCIAAIPIDTFHRSFYFRSLHITFTAKDEQKVEEAEAEAHSVIRQMRGLKPGEPDDFELFSNQGMGESLNVLAVVIGGAASAICLLALLVGGIGVMNIMLVSVMERTREIGVRKALGARPRTILGQFITEAVVLSATGGFIGLGIATLGVTVAGQLLDLPTRVPMFAVVLALVSSALTGLCAGIYPAARAARLDPIEALRHE